MSQSEHAREAKTETNGDGFGLAWYGDRPNPGLYKDVMPAWADGNLGSMASQIKSRLFFAHVRASTGTSVSRTNCHPFVADNWAFMHNGQFGGYQQFRQDVDAMLPRAFYHSRLGTTDSEAAFLLALGAGLAQNPKGALEKAVGLVEHMSRTTNETPHARVSLAVTDGRALYVVRYASDRFAPSLYHRKMQGSGGRLVVSEPLDDTTAHWEEIPADSFAVITPEKAEISAFRPLIPHRRAS